jgi:glycosyltransferase involved in cell wall biosynthesis
MEDATMPPGPASGEPLRVVIEGWRFLPHSYALVAQAHALCLLGRKDIELRFRDLPFYAPSWRRTRNILSADDERALEAIPRAEDAFEPDATLRFHAGALDVAPAPTGTKLVFATAEYRTLTREQLGSLRAAADVPDSVAFLVPSRWAAVALERFGVAAERVHVVPHGVDPRLLVPDVAVRARSRQALGIDGEFVFMSVGAMTWNKGIDVLLRAFAHVAASAHNVRLVLKGADALYPSRELLRVALGELPVSERESVARRLIYNGSTLSARAMADFFRAVDCYVSPYRAEAFNMPVLEAAACGVPLICTAGGPTDDFTEPSFAQHIASRVIRVPLDDGRSGDCLEPDVDHLTSLMREAEAQPARMRERGLLAAEHALREFTWEAVTRRLLNAVAESKAAPAGGAPHTA